MPSGAQCTAIPNSGFEFSSWEENLGDNSTQPISIWRPSYLDSIFKLRNGSDSPQATLNVTKFGTFTANFREASPVISPESLIILVITIVGTGIGSSIIAPYFSAFFAQRMKDKEKR